MAVLAIPHAAIKCEEAKVILGLFVGIQWNPQSRKNNLPTLLNPFPDSSISFLTSQKKQLLTTKMAGPKCFLFRGSTVTYNTRIGTIKRKTDWLAP